jgi:hypothetical protein
MKNFRFISFIDDREQSCSDLTRVMTAIRFSVNPPDNVMDKPVLKKMREISLFFPHRG